MDIVTLIVCLLALAIAWAISRIAADVRKIRKHFDKIDKANAPAPEAAVPAKARLSSFTPPPIRTPDPAR